MLDLYTYSICTLKEETFIMRTDEAEELRGSDFTHTVFTKPISSDFGETCCINYKTKKEVLETFKKSLIKK